MPSSISYFSPDDFEKSSLNAEFQRTSSRPSISSSENDWYLNKRDSCRSRQSSRSSSGTAPKPTLTPLPPSLEISLAILTSGLSVAAFHGIRSISEKRAAKKLAQQTRNTSLSRAESILIPSSMPEQMLSPPGELSATTVSSTPMAELDGSPIDLPPAYSREIQPDSHSSP